MFTYLPPIPFAVLAFALSISAVIYIFKGRGKYSKSIITILYCSIPIGILSGVHKLVMAYSYNELFKSILSVIQISSAFVFIGILIFITLKEIKTNPKANNKITKVGLFIVVFSASILGIMLFLSWLLK